MEEAISGLIGMGLVIVLAFWTFFFVIGLVIAYDKGRLSAGVGFALFFFSILATIVVCLWRVDERAIMDRMVRRGWKIRCPFCLSTLHRDAVHCNECDAVFRPVEYERRLDGLVAHEKAEAESEEERATVGAAWDRYFADRRRESQAD